MRVNLPRSFTGKEIMEAFKKAIPTEIPEKEKWDIEEFDGRFEYEPGSAIRVFFKKIILFALVWEKKHIFSKEFKWKDKLYSIGADSFVHYKEIEMEWLKPTKEIYSIEIFCAGHKTMKDKEIDNFIGRFYENLRAGAC